MGAKATDPKKSFALLAWLTSPALYIVSFFLPVLDNPEHPLPGYAAFLAALLVPLYVSFLALLSMHPEGLISLVLFPSWVANVVYWRAIHRLLTGQRRGVTARGVFAVLLGVSVLPVAIAAMSFPPGASGRHYVVPREGYWIWLGSMALLVFGGWVDRGNRLSEAKTENLAQSWED